MHIHIYAKDISALTILAIIVCVIWLILNYFFQDKKWFKILSGAAVVLSVYGILFYTVLRRTPSNEHIFTFAAKRTNEFFREMFMNALLYLPFGLTLSVLIGTWAVPAALFVSVFVEAWQYFAGTGLSQGTDVLMNTLGCFIGCLPHLTVFIIKKVRDMLKKKKEEKIEAVQSDAPKEKPTPSFLREDYPYQAIGEAITDVDTLEQTAIYEIKCPSCEMSIRSQGGNIKSTYEKMNERGCIGCGNRELVIKRVDMSSAKNTKKNEKND